MIETANLGKYAKLLIIVGDEAPNKAQDLFDILAQEPELRIHGDRRRAGGQAALEHPHGQ